MDKRIAVIIPCYNEEQTIRQVVTDFKKQLPQADIVVIDNSSVDHSAARAREAGAHILQERVAGKGKVMQIAFEKISAEIYVFVDGDATYCAKDVHALLAPVVDGRADMVVGNRLNAQNKEVWKFHRVWGNRFFCRILNMLYGSQFSDILSGFRILTRGAADKIPCVMNGFEIEAEITIRALKSKLRVIELPIHYQMRPAGSHSKLSAFQDGLKILRLMLKMRFSQFV